MTARSVISRFASRPIDVERSHGLRPDHPAVVEGRTIFPSMVMGSDEAPRFLVSGHNNPKLGKMVLKGERKGWPIFHLSLEERATCPRACAMWADCYGNAMPYARRHRPDALLIPYLWAELLTLARANRAGLLIRLHALGDFYSLEYVDFWRQVLDAHPNVHVFGYTAHPFHTEIRQAITRLTERWERFAIRFSTAVPMAQGATVFDADPERPDVIMCPAQVEKTTACASCGLCWAPAARERTIGFLRHGMKRAAEKPRGRPRKSEVAVSAPRAVGRPLKISLPAFEREEFEAAWAAEVPAENMARVFGCTVDEIERRARALGLARAA